MAERKPERVLAVPCELRLATLLPVSPWAAGAIVSSLLASSYLIIRWVLDIPWWIPDETLGLTLTTSARAEIVMSLMVGYFLAAGRYGAIAEFRDLQTLGRVDRELDLDRDERPALLMPREVVRRSRRWGAGGVTVGALFVFWVHQLLGISFLESLRNVSQLWLLTMVLLIFWMMLRGGYLSLNSGVADEAIRVDLTNLAPLRVYGRIALRGALLWIVAISIGSLIFVNQEFSAAQILFALAPVFTITFTIALGTLLARVRGVQRQVQRAKAEELERADAELGRVRELALSGEASSQERLAGLLAYRAHVVGLPEWPFDPSVRFKFGLYLLIPLGSWFGGAFAERFLGALLD